MNDLESESVKEIFLCLVCFPFILNAVLRNHLAKYEVANPQFVLHVVKSYVGDYASGRELVDQ